MSDFTIIDAIRDDKLFRPLFRDLGTWRAWIVFLKAVFGLPMEDGEIEIFRQCTGRQAPTGKPVPEVFAIVGRRGGKSVMAAVIACFLALFHDWRPYLAPGEIAWVMALATDREQARVILHYIKGILGSSRILGQEVERDKTREIILRNQVGVKVATCDFRSLRGYTVVAAVCDEIAFWRAEGANPAQEVLTALRPALATIPGSMILGISSPYGKSGVLYEAFRDKWGEEDEDVLIWKATSKLMNPTIKDRVIERAMKTDLAAAKSEWMAEFREDLASYVPPEVVEAAVVRGRYELPRIAGVNYRAFVDPSGGSGKDAMTLSICHKEKATDRIVQDCLKVQKPPFNPKICVREFAKIVKSYGISTVTGDRYSGDWAASTFREEGISYQNADKPKSEIYLDFLPLIMQGRVELLDHRQMLAELRQLERVTGRGRDIVDHPANLHDDAANAVAGAAVLAADFSTGPIPRIRGLWRDDDHGKPKEEKPPEPMKWIRMGCSKFVSPDGICSRWFKAGEAYEVPVSLANALIDSGVADEVKDYGG